MDEGQWVPIKQAAAQLGVSEKTIRRRLKRGQLEGRQVSGQRGPEWEIRLPNGLPEVVRPLELSPVVDFKDLIDLIADLHAKNNDLSQQNGWLQAQLQQKEEQIRMLEAPKRKPWWRLW